MTLIYCLSLAKVADILAFTHNAIFHVIVYPTTMSDIPEDIMIDTKVISLYQICQKMALIDCLTLANLRPSWMLPTMQSPGYFLAKPLCPAYLKTQWWTPNHGSASIMYKIGISLLFDLGKWRPSWIFSVFSNSSMVRILQHLGFHYIHTNEQ